MSKIVKTEAQWRAELSPEAYQILRQGGTERAFSHEGFPAEAGVFQCAGCGAALFDADTKYDSGSGWPSFTSPADSDAVDAREDVSNGMRRTEVLCASCDGHLGHVFPDGPGEGGLRYCINGGALTFTKGGDDDQA